MISPIMLAFQSDTTFSGLTYLDTILNILFFVDIGLNFTTAFFTDDFYVVDTHKVIFLNIESYEFYHFRKSQSGIYNHGF